MKDHLMGESFSSIQSYALSTLTTAVSVFKVLRPSQQFAFKDDLIHVFIGSRYRMSLCLFAEYTRLLFSQREILYSLSNFYKNVKIPYLACLKDYSENDSE
jgi:hypothetical protein